MRVATLYHGLLVLAFIGLCDTIFVMLTPNILRVGTKENVLLESHDFSGDTEAHIVVLNFPKKSHELYRGTVTLNSNNNFQALKTIEISANQLQANPREKQYVYLQAISPHFLLEHVVMVSFHSGYIFTQTDKPIYNPSETVHIRTFAMTQALASTNNSVTIMIKNPDNIVFEEVTRVASSGIVSYSYKLPEVVNVGIWKVISKYHQKESEFVSEFEVKEYVLPSFEVQLNPQKKFFHVDDNELKVTIVARYLYGEDVVGVAYVVFGVIVNGTKITIQRAPHRVDVSGTGTVSLLKSDIESITTNGNIRDLVDYSIYIRATVLTSTGSDLVQAETSGLKIVTSPYKILFTKTSKYFKPGMPFDVLVFVTNPDGTPARGIPVKVTPEESHGVTQSNGLARLVVNTKGGIEELKITVKTFDPNIQNDQQASNEMTASPYKPKNMDFKNYLYINIRAAEMSPGEDLHFEINLQNDDSTVKNDIEYFSYLVINKGRIIQTGRKKRDVGQIVIAMSLTVTKAMVPSFRIVAYYYVKKGGQEELVSDSVWVDVTDSCIGELLVEPHRSTDVGKIYRPGNSFELKISGDPGAKVGLVAVDKAVFLLNNKNKLTQSKIWDVIEKDDLGCTPGGGGNSMGVFTDAGLQVKTNLDIATQPRTNPKCPEPQKRRRRSVILIEHKTNLASKYKDETQNKCCRDGMNDIPMDYSCEKRAQYITAGDECIKAFLHCCTEISKRKKEMHTGTLELSRSQESDMVSEDDVRIRTHFDESWLWQVETLSWDPKGNRLSSTKVKGTLKDSITEWEILAISISPDKGICVAKPFDLIAKMEFFIDLKLPYSVVRNEQVEIKAVLYNYGSDRLKVRVDLMENSLICSAASHKTRFRQDVYIDELSSLAIPFTIVPLHLGEMDIEVKAIVYNNILSDGVKKKLLVVPEGTLIKKHIQTVILNPAAAKGAKQVVSFGKINLNSVVPDTKPQTFIDIRGELLAETVDHSIDGNILVHLIRMPGGCVEQNMASITAPVIATHYLDKSYQWESAGFERRQQAIKFIQQGYQNQLAYRKPDGSYPPYRTMESSTWLTAYVVKVFSMASSLISVQEDMLCEAVKFLILKKQLPNGAFTEDAPVTDVYITTGGLKGGEGHVTLTAFIVIAMAEARPFCEHSVPSLRSSIDKSVLFLEVQLHGLQRPYSAAISSYALALARNGNRGNNLKEYLMRFASADKTYWPEPASREYTLEATAYALLALVTIGEKQSVEPIVEWLLPQMRSGGGFGTTQTTMITFQALAAYMETVPQDRDVDLDVAITLSGRSKDVSWKFVPSNVYVAKSQRANIDQNITVTASGKGKGIMTVTTIYNALQDEQVAKDDCKKFVLTTEITRASNVLHAPSGAHETYTLKICMQYQDEKDSTMTILDVSMLSGFAADLEDLKRLTNQVDQYIQNYVIERELTNGSLIIHLYRVPHKSLECISFNIHQMFKVGMLQPAAITIYEYYSPENRCTKFYHPDKNPAVLSQICKGEVCKCVEETCSSLIKLNKSITSSDRQKEACKPGVDYVYKVRVEEIDLSKGYDEYTMEVVEVIKQGTDVFHDDRKRTYTAHSSCRQPLDLRKGRQYLIMGNTRDLWSIKEKLTYIIGGTTWVEWWPTKEESQTEESRIVYLGINDFVSELMEYGCSN
ncbi:complement C3-like [Acipenser ruthenus]|uniref:complement C3-like n=1 Tax=Acipenser ruthenus TaxID=7906 RepID=UPI00274249C1|nr:complement C3-like [Acipenser ruthenus]